MNGQQVNQEAVLAAMRQHLADFMVLARDLDIELSLETRDRLIDLLEELEFLSAILKAVSE